MLTTWPHCSALAILVFVARRSGWSRQTRARRVIGSMSFGGASGCTCRRDPDTRNIHELAEPLLPLSRSPRLRPVRG